MDVYLKVPAATKIKIAATAFFTVAGFQAWPEQGVAGASFSSLA
jgi:hypothetical protein